MFSGTGVRAQTFTSTLPIVYCLLNVRGGVGIQMPWATKTALLKLLILPFTTACAASSIPFCFL